MEAEEIGRTHRALEGAKSRGKCHFITSEASPENPLGKLLPGTLGASYLDVTAVTQLAPSTVRIWTFLTDLPSH